MNAKPRYAVTPDPVHGFTVTRNGAFIGTAPTRYGARKLAGDDAEMRRGLGEALASRPDNGLTRLRRAEAAERTRLRGWKVDGRPER